MSIEITPFLSLNGKAKNAINFYEKYLQAKVLFIKNYQEFKEMDATFNYSEGEEEYISHSVLEIGKSTLMIADEIMSKSKKEIVGTNFSLCVQSSNQQEIENIYNALIENENVEVIVPLAPNVFGYVYGIVEDPFGVTIQLLNEK